MIKYSFIIPTYNRLDEIKELVDSLNQLDFDNSMFELIIVDDGSTDGTDDYISKISTRFPINYIKQSNQGPGKARNKGMTVANGDYFLFVDSDCMLPVNYLSNLNQWLLKSNYDAFGGPDTYHPSFSPLLKAINYSMTSFLGTGGTRGSTKSISKFYPRSFNMGIKREVYQRINGFSDMRHGQDMDYSARIYEAGFKVGFIPNAHVFHKRRTSLWRFFKQIHNWGVTRINLGAAHKDMLKPIHFAPAIIVVATIVVLLLSTFIPFIRLLLPVLFIGCWLVALIAFLQSFILYKSLKISFLSVLTLYWQVFAYGIGTLNGIWQKWILRRPLAIGITKNYYK